MSHARETDLAPDLDARLQCLREAITDTLDETVDDLMNYEDETGHDMVAVIYAALNLQPNQPALAAWIANKIPALIAASFEVGYVPPAVLLTILTEMGRYMDNGHYQIGDKVWAFLHALESGRKSGRYALRPGAPA
jgi:hypothetical protein